VLSATSGQECSVVFQCSEKSFWLRTGEAKTSCIKVRYCNFISTVEDFASPQFFSRQRQLSVKFQVFDSVAVSYRMCMGTRSISVRSLRGIQFKVLYIIT